MFSRILILFMFLSFFVVEAKEELNFGLLYKKIFSSKKEADIGSSLWLKQMKQQNIDANINILFYTNEEKLIKDYKNKKLSSIIVNGLFYWENRKKLNHLSVDKWGLSRNNYKFEQFYLIKNKKSDFNFRNKGFEKILFKERVGLAWFKTIFNKKKMDINKERVKKEKRLILDVFFNKNTISVVGKDLYESMLKINPQIREKIEIVAKSKSIFLRGIGFTRKEIQKKKRDILFKMLNKINKSDTNLEVLSFLQIQKVFLLKEEDLTQLNKFYKKYKKLKNNEKI